MKELEEEHAHPRTLRTIRRIIRSNGTLRVACLLHESVVNLLCVRSIARLVLAL